LPKPATPFESLLQGLKLMPEEILSSDLQAWQSALDELDPRQHNILKWRHGLQGRPELTLQEIGTKLKITREWVRQLEERGHRLLRMRAVERHLINEAAPNRLSYSYRGSYWPPGTTPGRTLR
jgi:DNA-binding CsgD family transcriptional regulator